LIKENYPCSNSINNIKTREAEQRGMANALTSPV